MKNNALNFFEKALDRPSKCLIVFNSLKRLIQIISILVFGNYRLTFFISLSFYIAWFLIHGLVFRLVY